MLNGVDERLLAPAGQEVELGDIIACDLYDAAGELARDQGVKPDPVQRRVKEPDVGENSMPHHGVELRGGTGLRSFC
jgi:hypothetical protein